jgi:hypothetical protein
MVKHNFDNIYLLSNTKELKELPNEWLYIEKQSYESNIGHCICNALIKHVNYFINIKTNKYIQVGDTCKNKLKLIDKTNKKGLEYIINSINDMKCDYLTINNLFEYSNKIKDYILEECIVKN